MKRGEGRSGKRGKGRRMRGGEGGSGKREKGRGVEEGEEEGKEGE